MPRNSRLRNSAQFSEPSPLRYAIDGQFACPIAHGGNLSGTNGQSCYWFSNGCTMDCATCDGASRGPIPSIECAGPAEPFDMW